MYPLVQAVAMVLGFRWGMVDMMVVFEVESTTSLDICSCKWHLTKFIDQLVHLHDYMFCFLLSGVMEHSPSTTFHQGRTWWRLPIPHTCLNRPEWISPQRASFGHAVWTTSSHLQWANLHTHWNLKLEPGQTIFSNVSSGESQTSSWTQWWVSVFISIVADLLKALSDDFRKM